VYDVATSLEEADRALQVAVEGPAEGVRIAVALAFTSPIEDEHPVTVADEHPRMLLRPLLAGEHDHRGAVAR
jgi:hypothetical protein